RDLRRLDRRLRGLTPPLLPLAGLLGGGAVTAGVGTKSAVVGVAALAIASGGAIVVEQHRAGPGDPAPGRVDATYVGKRSVRRGGALPPGTYAVTARVRVPAGVPAPGKARTVTLTCPGTTRTAQNLGIPGGVPSGLEGATQGGKAGLGERSTTLYFPSTRLPRPVTFTAGVLCRRPDRNGSLVADPRPTRPGETPMVTIPGSHYVHYRPGGVMVGTLSGRQPVSVRRFSRSRTWALVVADARHIRGWVLTTYLRPR
ncbi:hypothetical protein AB0L40_16330, partial [Patulibacter sp. NPDC049589]